MVKILSATDLALLREGGASVSHEKREVSVDGLSLLVEQMRRVAEANETIARKRNDDLLAAVTRLTEVIQAKESKDVDLKPLVEAVGGLKQTVEVQPHGPVTYRLDVERDQRQLLTSATFTPVKH
jgi:hypothetical protein